MEDIGAVLFDLDGTLAVHDGDPVDLWAEAFDRAGVDPAVEPEDAAAVEHGTLPTVESQTEFYAELYRAAVTRSGGEPDRATVQAVATAYVDAYDPAAVSFRPGARAALSTAQAAHDVGLVTNGGEDVQGRKLDALGIEDAFDTVVYCDPADGIEPKPDPRPIERAVDELGCEPERTVLVGDDHAADVTGAHNADIRSVWVPRAAGTEHRASAPDPAPTRVASSMEAVDRLLDG